MPMRYGLWIMSVEVWVTRYESALLNQNETLHRTSPCKDDRLDKTTRMSPQILKIITIRNPSTLLILYSIVRKKKHSFSCIQLRGFRNILKYYYKTRCVSCFLPIWWLPRRNATRNQWFESYLRKSTVMPAYLCDTENQTLRIPDLGIKITETDTRNGYVYKSNQVSYYINIRIFIWMNGTALQGWSICFWVAFL
jgi:hypothetical protein